MFKNLISLAVRFMASAQIRAAIVARINAMEATNLPGPAKYASVKAVALTYLQARSGRFVDALVSMLVLLTKG